MDTTTCSIRLNCPIEPDRISLKKTDEPEGFTIVDNKTGKSLGNLKQAKDSQHPVELFFGKGGFMGMISSPQNARYFGLPGSSISVGGVSLTLEGPALSSNQDKTTAQRKGITPQQHTIQASILGAGLATRFERISGDSTQYSKPAVPLAGSVSVIECIANGLARHGFTRLIVNTFFKPESLKAGLARSKAEQVIYIDESEPSGTAGGLRKMLLDDQYGQVLDQTKPLLIVQGDSVTDANFSELMEAHIANQALVTIGCQEVAEKDVDKFGIIVTDRSGQDGLSGKIVAFQEKPSLAEAKSRLGNTGFYIFSPKSYPLIREIYQSLLAQAEETAEAAGKPAPSEVPFDFATDLFSEILKRSQADSSLGSFWAQAVEGYWSDIGNPAQYLESIHDLYAGKADISMPADRERYYRNGVIFWEGAAGIADREGAQLSGNVVVAVPFTSA